MTRADVLVAVVAAVAAVFVVGVGVILYGLIRSAGWADRVAPQLARNPGPVPDGVARLQAWLDEPGRPVEPAPVTRRAPVTFIDHGDIRAALRTHLEQPCRPVDRHFCLSHDPVMCRRFTPCCGSCPTDPT